MTESKGSKRLYEAMQIWSQTFPAIRDQYLRSLTTGRELAPLIVHDLKSRGWTVKAIARAVGVSETYIHKIKSHQNTASPRMICELARLVTAKSDG